MIKKICLLLIILGFTFLNNSLKADSDSSYKNTDPYLTTPLSKDTVESLDNLKKILGDDNNINPNDAETSKIKKVEQQFVINADGSVILQETGRFYIVKKIGETPLLFSRKFAKYREDSFGKNKIKTFYKINEATSSSNVNINETNDSVEFVFSDTTNHYNDTTSITGNYTINLTFINLLSANSDYANFSFATRYDDFSIPIDNIFATAEINASDPNLLFASSFTMIGNVKQKTDAKIINNKAGFQNKGYLKDGESFNITLDFNKVVDLKVREELKSGIKKIKVSKINNKDEQANKPESHNPYASLKKSLIFAAFKIFLITLLYYVVIWYIYGKDSPLPPITPSFYPPKNLSAGKAGAIYYGRAFNPLKSLTASLISLAKEGFVTIFYRKYENVSFHRTKKPLSDNHYEEEQILLAELFKNNDKITLSNTSVNTNAPDAIKKYSEVLTGFKDRMIEKNTFSIVLGIIISLSIAIYYAFTLSGLYIVISGLFAFYYMFFSAFILNIRVNGWKLKSGDYTTLLFLTLHFSIFISVFPYAICLSERMKPDNFYSGYVWVLLFMFLCLALHIIFPHFMDKPKKETVKILAELEGLKMYIETTEKNRYNKLTPEIYETLLPFAVLFNLEASWHGSIGINQDYIPIWWDKDSTYEKEAFEDINNIILNQQPPRK